VFHPVDDYLALPRAPHAWIVQDILPTSGLASLYGRPKVGKSYAALQLAAAVGSPAAGEWLGFPIRNHGRVAYLQIDSPRELWMERIEEVQAAGVVFENVFFADALDAPYPFNILTDGYDWLKTSIAAFDPDVLIFDTIRELHGGDENDSAQMKNVVALARSAARRAACLFLAHSRKGAGLAGASDPDITDEMRGSGYISGRMDSIIRMTDHTIQVKGRAISETTFAIKQDPESHLVFLADDFHHKAYAVITAASKDETDRELARRLHASFPKRSYEACRSLVRRMR